MPILTDPRPGRHLSLSDRAHSLAIILQAEFGVPFRFFGAQDGRNILAADWPARGPELSAEELAWVVQFGAVEQSGVTATPDGSYRLALSLYDEGRPALVALALKSPVARPHPDAIREEALRLER
jgi:hypothetical protein